jgi:hypothetical protein
MNDQHREYGPGLKNGGEVAFIFTVLEGPETTDGALEAFADATRTHAAADLAAVSDLEPDSRADVPEQSGLARREASDDSV